MAEGNLEVGAPVSQVPNITPEQLSRAQKFMEHVFNHGGGVYVGMASMLTLISLIMESLNVGWVKWVTPAWWTAVPYGLYCVILVTFAGSKTLSYFMDSKYNSPQGQPPRG